MEGSVGVNGGMVIADSGLSVEHDAQCVSQSTMSSPTKVALFMHLSICSYIYISYHSFVPPPYI